MSNKRTPPGHQPGRTMTSSRPVAPAPRPTQSLDNSNRSTSHVFENKPVEVSRSQIAEAAYYLWLSRGGSELQNWLDAEKSLAKPRRA